jgi:hypothetical protein
MPRGGQRKRTPSLAVGPTLAALMGMPVGQAASHHAIASVREALTAHLDDSNVRLPSAPFDPVRCPAFTDFWRFCGRVWLMRSCGGLMGLPFHRFP